MKVSIITVCYNSEKTISETLSSVAYQTYGNIEHILIDGNSTDLTNDVIKNFQDSVSIHLSEDDNGLYDAMNKGIRLASGDIIGILNSDDMFYDENVISNIVSAFNNSCVDAIYTDLIYVKNNDPKKPTRFYSSKVFNKFLIRFGIMLPHPTFYVKSQHYEKFGLYKLNYRVAADFELLTRFFCKGLKMQRLPFISVKMREGGISSSGLLWRIHQNIEIVRACKENGIYTNIFFIMLKLPYKLITLMTRWFMKVPN